MICLCLSRTVKSVPFIVMKWNYLALIRESKTQCENYFKVVWN